MDPDRLLRTGIIGSLGIGLCCFTPILVIALTGIGLAALVGWLDLVLLPALAGFLALTGYAWWQRRRRRVRGSAP